MPKDYATSGMERLRAALRGDPVMTSPEDAFAYGEGIPPDATWRNLLPAVELGLGLAPGSGEAMSLQDAWNASGRAGNALLSGDYGQAASDYLNMGTGLLGAIPGAGIIARGTKRGAAWMDRNLPEGFNRLLDSVYPDDPRSTTNIFAGPTAKTADHAALAKAQEMKAQGASRADIWRETGWDLEKADQIPRFEIPDNQSFYRGTSPATSSDAETAFQHPEFYSAYPDAGKVKITEIDRPGMNDPRGSFSEFYNEIELGGRDKSSTALHEMQHYVQDAEGFAPGGNPGQFANIWGPQADRVRIPMETRLVAEELGIQDIPWPGDPDYARLKEAVRQSMEDKSGRPFKFRYLMDGMDDFDWEYGSTMRAPVEEIREQTRLGLRNLGMDQYNRVAGEVEARNVQTRLPMTAAERRATPPWETQDVPDDQQIVRFGGGGPQNSIDMGEASRLTRSRQMGYADEPFYRGEATGNTPDQYDTAFFSRDPQYAQGFAEKGGQDAAREFRLNLTNTFSDGGALTASKYGSLVEAAAKNDPALAKELAESVAPGKGVEWLIGFSKANPDFVVVEPGAAAFVRQAIETNSSDPVGLFRSAGFTAIDSGRDVRKLTGEGIRLKNARFDPSKASSRDIMAGIAGASLLPAYLLSTSQKD